MNRHTERVDSSSEHIFLSPFYPEYPWSAPVPPCVEISWAPRLRLRYSFWKPARSRGAGPGTPGRTWGSPPPGFPLCRAQTQRREGSPSRTRRWSRPPCSGCRWSRVLEVVKHLNNKFISKIFSLPIRSHLCSSPLWRLVVAAEPVPAFPPPSHWPLSEVKKLLFFVFSTSNPLL